MAGLTAWASRRWTGQGGPAKGQTGPVAEAREGVWEGTWRRWGGGVVGGSLEAAGLEACAPEGPPGGAPGDGRGRELGQRQGNVKGK